MNTGNKIKWKEYVLVANCVYGVIELFQSKISLFSVQHISRPPENYPVDDLDKGDDAEAEKEAEESSKRGDEVHRAHPDAPLEF